MWHSYPFTHPKTVILFPPRCFQAPRAESGPWEQWPSGFCQWFLTALLQGWN